MTKDLAHSSAIPRHPSAALYDRVFKVAFPAVAIMAAEKNVPLLADEQEAVLHYGLRRVRRKTMREVLNSDQAAILSLQLAINHSLDVLASSRVVWVCAVLCGEDANDTHTILRKAEEALRSRSANDERPTMNVWPDPVQGISDYCRTLLLSPQLTLPGNATVRSRMQVMTDTRVFSIGATK